MTQRGDQRFWSGAPVDGAPDNALWLSLPVAGIGLDAHVLASTDGVTAQALLWGALAAALGGLFWGGGIVLWERRRRVALELAREAEAKTRLEAVVAERTTELSSANARLRTEVVERTNAEAQLRELQEELVQAGKLKALGEMSAGISHELNQPLTVIRSLTENTSILLDRGQDSEARSTLDRIGQMAERMGRIIRNLRSFARKEGEPATDVDLVMAVKEALLLVQQRIDETETELRFDPPDLPVTVRGGPVRLQQVIVNLVNNALDAMDDQAGDRMIALAISSDSGAEARLSVRDTGPGLSDAGQVFDPFFTTKPVGKGLGLGLSISYGIVQSFGGRITGANHPDGGAVFTVFLQRVPAKERAA